MRYFLLAFVLAVGLVIGIAGKRGKISRKPPLEVFSDMDRQPKIRPQTPSEFFADGRASRLPVDGTVARGSHFLEEPLNTGMVTGTTNLVAVNPMKVTPFSRYSCCKSPMCGIMTMHGPHQVAQNSTT